MTLYFLLLQHESPKKVIPRVIYNIIITAKRLNSNSLILSNIQSVFTFPHGPRNFWDLFKIHVFIAFGFYDSLLSFNLV